MAGKTGKRYYTDYGYSPESGAIRPEYRYIVNWVEKGSKVLDMGCGDGSLGSLLIRERDCEVYGIDLSASGVESASNKGVHVVTGDLDEGLDFPDGSFDYVVINVTLQMVYRPGFVLSEALRVGRKVIVSFPNLAHWAARLELFFLGRMPRKPLYGYQWHNTRHIHLFSYEDFCDYLEELGAKITKKVFFGYDSKHESLLARLFPNLFSMEAILMIEKA